MTWNFVRLHGVPLLASEQNIRDFFGDDIRVENVYVIKNLRGTSSGEAYVLFEKHEDMMKVLYLRGQLFERYHVSVFPVGEVEAIQIVRHVRQCAVIESHAAIRINGVSSKCTADDIHEFFNGINVIDVIFGEFPEQPGRRTGEAYVQFATIDDAERALQMNKQFLGDQFLQIYPADASAFNSFKELKGARTPSPIMYSRQFCASKVSQLGMVSPYNFGSSSGYGVDDYSSQYSDNWPSDSLYDWQHHWLNYYQRLYEANDFVAHPFYNRESHSFVSADYRVKNVGHASMYEFPTLPFKSSGHRRYNQAEHHFKSSFQRNNEGRQAASGNLNNREVYMRGLPYRVTGQEIVDFFAPLQCVQIKLGLLVEDGRASGDGIVEFSSVEDAFYALSFDRKCISTRYIELFTCDNARLPHKVMFYPIVVNYAEKYERRSKNTRYFGGW